MRPIIKISSIISFLAGVLVFFALLGSYLYFSDERKGQKPHETSRDIYEATICHDQTDSVKGNETQNSSLPEAFLPDEKGDTIAFSNQSQELTFSDNTESFEPEQSISNILDYGLTQDQINSFIEDDDPTQIFSNLHEESHLIPSILNKISQIQPSIYRNYLLALINGLPEQQRLSAASELINSHREVDQIDARRIINLTENHNQAFDTSQYQLILEQLNQNDNLKISNAIEQLHRLLNNKRVFNNDQIKELENALQDIASSNYYDLELRYKALSVIKLIIKL